MDNPRPEKVAVVEEVRARLDASQAALLTEYRGLNVSATATLRRALHDAGGEYKVYKNTLVRFAARDLGLEIDDLLTGPTAIAFVNGDPVLVAKALRDFARTNPSLVVKGGLLGSKALDADAVRALADVEPREVLLARLAGALAAPMQQFAGLLQALPRNFAYGLRALIDQRGPEDPSTEDPSTEDPSTEDPSTEDPSTEDPSTEDPSTEDPSTEEPPAVVTGEPAPSADLTADDSSEPAAPSSDSPVADAADTTQES